MKKLLALMLVLVLGLCCTACAQKPDLDKLDQQQLEALIGEIDLQVRELDYEALQKSGTPVKLAAGIYEVGKDIPVGKWMFENVEYFEVLIGTCASFNEKGASVWELMKAMESTVSAPATEKPLIRDLKAGEYLGVFFGPVLLTKPE